MLKKRVIFVLLYGEGSFFLSRNFRLQKIGDHRWLKENYNFSKISFHIDELVVLNISKKSDHEKEFCEVLKRLTKECFLPIAAGGGVRSLEHAQALLMSGADKIVLNTTLFEDFPLACRISEIYGQQCVVGQADIKRGSDQKYRIFKNSGQTEVSGELKILNEIDSKQVVGEWILNSIDRDGTGQGFDLEMLTHLSDHLSAPLIILGGAGNSSHLINGLRDPRVDAVATAHLHNFVGDGLSKARKLIKENSINLATWPELIR